MMRLFDERDLDFVYNICKALEKRLLGFSAACRPDRT
jgi:hypothetical protein